MKCVSVIWLLLVLVALPASPSTLPGRRRVSFGLMIYCTVNATVVADKS